MRKNKYAEIVLDTPSGADRIFVNIGIKKGQVHIDFSNDSEHCMHVHLLTLAYPIAINAMCESEGICDREAREKVIDKLLDVVKEATMDVYADFIDREVQVNE